LSDNNNAAPARLKAGRKGKNMAIYDTRYQASKAASGADVIVKVCGGYAIMTPDEYSTWRKQR